MSTDTPDFTELPELPVRQGTLDPELVNLRPRSKRLGGPWLLLSVIALCFYIVWTLRADMRFALQSEKPTELVASGDTSGQQPEPVVISWLSPSIQQRLKKDTYISVNRPIDITRGFRVANNNASSGKRLVPFIGTNNQLWVVTSGMPAQNLSGLDMSFSGRLGELSDSSFNSPFRRAIEGSTQVWSAPVENFVEALQKGSPIVSSSYGERLHLQADTQVIITRIDTNHCNVMAPSVSPFVTQGLWSELLTTLELEHEKGVTTDDGWRFFVRAPKKKVDALLFAAGRHEPLTTDITSNYDVTWGDMRYTKGSLFIGQTEVPQRSQIKIIAVVTKTKIPPKVFLLFEDEHPSVHSHVPFVVSIAGLLGLLFLWRWGILFRRWLRFRLSA